MKAPISIARARASTETNEAVSWLPSGNDTIQQRGYLTDSDHTVSTTGVEMKPPPPFLGLSPGLSKDRSALSELGVSQNENYSVACYAC